MQVPYGSDDRQFITTDANGNIFFTDASGTHRWFARFDSSGTVMWAKAFDTSQPTDYADGVAVRTAVPQNALFVVAIPAAH